eukprot:Nk52_evm7s237 gene=Nk52_evmTU7s237
MLGIKEGSRRGERFVQRLLCGECSERLKGSKVDEHHSVTCLRCGCVLYCSTACREVHWEAHKKICIDYVHSAIANSGLGCLLHYIFICEYTLEKIPCWLQSIVREHSIEDLAQPGRARAVCHQMNEAYLREMCLLENTEVEHSTNEREEEKESEICPMEKLLPLDQMRLQNIEKDPLKKEEGVLGGEKDPAFLFADSLFKELQLCGANVTVLDFLGDKKMKKGYRSGYVQTLPFYPGSMASVAEENLFIVLNMKLLFVTGCIMAGDMVRVLRSVGCLPKEGEVWKVRNHVVHPAQEYVEEELEKYPEAVSAWEKRLAKPEYFHPSEQCVKLFGEELCEIWRRLSCNIPIVDGVEFPRRGSHRPYLLDIEVSLLEESLAHISDLQKMSFVGSNWRGEDPPDDFEPEERKRFCSLHLYGRAICNVTSSFESSICEFNYFWGLENCACTLQTEIGQFRRLPSDRSLLGISQCKCFAIISNGIANTILTDQSMRELGESHPDNPPNYARWNEKSCYRRFHGTNRSRSLRAVK